ncbi:hypothetical protein [Oceanibacterium hippocampi]|uniref:Uncharacterized protein n=1 Tax=Oceanibacterium hippocampi TaxID=745714 RepID=A0A1Y5R6C2_9PROT|nr:hypothetical protein [Oceanibacterium hippocampi]SLN10268.1 hypothetical protein OCH7691_00029 [Oceanibacterium hippocampi]
MPPQGSEVFASLDHAGRVWAVAPVAGRSAKLARLHDQLANAWRLGDRLVYLGDYLAPGPDIVGTLDELLMFRRELLCRPGMEPGDIAYLRGAQEEIWRKLLQLQFATDPIGVFDWMLRQGIGAAIEAYGDDVERARNHFRAGAQATTRWSGEMSARMRAHPGHDDILAGLRRAAYTAEGTLLFVHAGIDPDRPLAAQNDTFWWGSRRFADMAEPYEGFRLVVRGRDRERHGEGAGTYWLTIDGGSGDTGTLNAGCFSHEGELVDLIEV